MLPLYFKELVCYGASTLLLVECRADPPDFQFEAAIIAVLDVTDSLQEWTSECIDAFVYLKMTVRNMKYTVDSSLWGRTVVLKKSSKQHLQPVFEYAEVVVPG